MRNNDVEEVMKQIESTFGYRLAKSHWCLRKRVTFESQRIWTKDDAREFITKIMPNDLATLAQW